VFEVASCSSSTAQKKGTPLVDSVADRITKRQLLKHALPKMSELILDIYAARIEEPLDVSIASIIVFANKDYRGGEHHLGTLKSTADLANVQLGIGTKISESLAGDSTYIQDVLKVASVNQEVASAPGMRQEEVELKWNQEFTNQDATEIAMLPPMLSAAGDSASIGKT